MKFNKIFEAFPPPKFLNIPFAGLSISDSAIHCIQFGKKDGRIYIEKYAEVELSPGTIVSGEMHDKEKVLNIWKTLKKDLGFEHVKISLPEEKVYIFTAKIPIVKPEEVLSAVESKMEESVPVSQSELLFDYVVVDHRDKGHLDVVVTALPISVIDMYVGMAETAGLSLLALGIESQAITRALLPKGSRGTSLLVHFGKEKVGLYVESDRLVRFTSTILLQRGPIPNPDFLSQEVKKLYTYWHTLKENLDKPEKKITQIIVVGENIPEWVILTLSNQSGTPIVLGNVWTNAFDVNLFTPAIPFPDSLRYGPAVGLALPSDTLI
ncbi:MAG: Type IV pilus assembly protein PilM [Parcubacteria group bacterium GW2011_GWF2_39_8b]|uniref:SHS2 domain-containing protein n=1 Tax=Candidatus Zambryskibacteria bacterium RIFCSPLOWO2_12_39_8 TaxID=1802774 RepID=A0A1G2UVZ9_9BACT|nr:MAG: Type IV pilus assembly protein PilM [Parcubacteria group bacterium GW2011_GWF2_39_8b]KKR45802.1 MAG: Type IV pilus assembly protein PilM [Parcubacteria group bacterium GW2011_GWA2_40_14]OHB08686.1 MAG: hypothetical protein A2W64_02160 [Candidatus Zambryskibacteria bacterium RIFCSPLOWO2_02_39_10]OHB09679.1 MAG: hypothetical protein A3I21_00235 [Candidatus Zambryskibacteria bacterium RIFCSPLOWO2_02_FULL_39_69]OHB13580.1 MAG: hypothetical protein A2Y49_03300 [Candidatus Zambryskibacteria b